MDRIIVPPTSLKNFFCCFPDTFGFMEKENVQIFCEYIVLKNPMFGSSIESPDIPCDNLHHKEFGGGEKKPSVRHWIYPELSI
jgi:hypothetical protein